MSAFVSVETEFEDVDCIVDALVAAGFDRTHVEVPAEPVSLVGYHGDVRPQKAAVIVRRRHIGRSSNDMGFYKNEKGKYALWLSQADHSLVPHHLGMKNKDELVGRLKQGYAEAKVSKAAKAGHWGMKKTKVGGKVVLTLSKWA